MPHLHFEAHDGQGPHLLLLHGFLMSRAQWQLNLAELSRVCRPVVAELWGHGKSVAPDDPNDYHPDGYIAQFEHIRAQLGIDRWFVCGYSLGAGLTIRYALTHPERVIGHVFTNSTSGFADSTQVDAWRAGSDEAARKIVAGGIDAIEKMPVHPRHARRLPADLYDALMIEAAQLNPAGIANTLRYTNPNTTVRGRVHANTRPALLICGREETRFAPHREFARTTMPNLAIVDLPVGHGVNMEDPAGFNRALADFVTRYR